MSTGGGGVCMSLVKSDRYLCLSNFFFSSLKAIHQPIRRSDSERNESEMMVPTGSHLWSPRFCQVVYHVFLDLLLVPEQQKHIGTSQIIRIS